MTADGFIKLGFWSQLVLLLLVDWGTLASFARGHGSWPHYIGFAVVNLILLYLTWIVWGWLSDKKPPEDPLS